MPGTLSKQSEYQCARCTICGDSSAVATSSRCLRGTVNEKQTQRRVQKVVNATLLLFGILGVENNEGTMNESILSTNTFEVSTMQSAFAGDQDSAHDVMPPHCLQDFPLEQTEVDWERSETMARPVDDTPCAYLGQLLN